MTIVINEFEILAEPVPMEPEEPAARPSERLAEEPVVPGPDEIVRVGHLAWQRRLRVLAT